MREESIKKPIKSAVLTVAILSLVLLAAQAAMAISGVVDVKVDIAPALKGRTTPEQTVFIFAKAVKGPRAPVAVVRTKVARLPLTVRLDDSKAVAPFLKISNFGEVTLTARVSKSGGARKVSGDLEGSAGPVKTETTGTPVKLMIDHEVH